MVGRCGVIAWKLVMMVENFGVLVTVIVINDARIQRYGMDSVTMSLVVSVGMGRCRRNEAIACKSKRKAEAHEAPEKRHRLQLYAICCNLLNGVS
ncbi:MAG: hypothetical protein B7Y90_18580 [Alphaproteobacteria bacterium 32-64-14]|nr:MAG: hypothetical protein B7Y90_18580 [Alphaproteobacteria bacterium 32-64-14]